MKYADSITKKFLTYAQPRTNPPGNTMLDWQDPTYLGFQWRILNTQDFSRGDGGYDLDYFPQGLFLPDNDTDSAVSYFIRTNQLARAQMIQKFKKEFLDLLQNAPWYFTKVTGLADIWKILPGNSFRGKDKKLTIETEEAIDLKITYLMDLYRKAVFDPAWMRYALPENQRMFAMELVVAEIRPMHTSLSNWKSLVNNPGTKTGFVLNDIDGLFGNAQRTRNGGEDETAGNTNEENSTKAPWTTATFLSFRFEQCTFDVFGTSPNFLETVTKVPDTKAINTIVINTPYISEVNTYGLLGAILKESYYRADYYYDITDPTTGTSITTPETLGSGNPGGVRPTTSQLENAYDNTQGNGDDSELENVFKDEQDQEQDNNNLGSVYEPSPGGGAGGAGGAGGGGTDPFAAAAARLGKAATNFATGFVENLINQAGLGNVYTGSPFTAVGSLQGFVNNPFATTQALLQQFTQQGGAASPGALGNIGFTGDEAELLTGFIGQALPPLTPNGLVTNDMGKTVEDDIIKNPNLVVGNLPKRILSGPDIVKARLGNIYKP